MPNQSVDLSDMQAWLLQSFLAEVDFPYVLSKMNDHLSPEEKRLNAEATMRVLRAVGDQLMEQGFRKLGPR